MMAEPVHMPDPDELEQIELAEQALDRFVEKQAQRHNTESA
jgi:hypothetical protein